jgi:hypothetical protein
MLSLARLPLFRFLSACFLLVLAAAQAAPIVPVYDVRTRGAKGDGTTVDTDAINQTILVAAGAGGGTVYFPPGTYLSGSIHLQSNITLYLEAGAIIEAASPAVTKFDAPEPNEWGDKFHYQDFGHSHWQNSLIWGIGLHNVSILGPGLIHGTGLDNGFDRFASVGPEGDKRYHPNPEGGGNKSIALRDCHNVILRDFSILHGGWFSILATGVDNLTIDNLKIDTNRDGMDIDACQNVRITNCSVNSPWDDGICLKASYGLGRVKHCDNITIANCYVSGNFVEGTLLDGTFKHCDAAYLSYATGRIKLGTESNGDFKNIAITNCVFEECRGIAIESVDGSHIEDVAISNITMRHSKHAPIFIRLGARMRGPEGTPVGSIRHVSISNLVVSDSDWPLGNVISGIPGHPIEDIRFSNIRISFQGGGDKELAARVPPEEEKSYPEPGMFGHLPSYGFFFRHVNDIEMHDVKIDFAKPEARPAVVLDDVRDAWFHHLNFARGTDNAPLFDLRNVSDFSVTDSRHIIDTRREGAVTVEKF